MIVRTIAALLTACALATAAHADTSYTVFTPTAEPYTKFQNFVSPGSFTDSFNFTLDTTTTGYIWLFPRQDALFVSGLDNTTGVTLTLVNNDTEKEWYGVLYPTLNGSVSLLTPGVLELVLAGFDPNRSLYLDGTFDAGHYSALISGTATGVNGGSYVAKFNLASPVPEAGSMAMMGLGLGIVGLVTRRKKAVAAA